MVRKASAGGDTTSHYHYTGSSIFLFLLAPLIGVVRVVWILLSRVWLLTGLTVLLLRAIGVGRRWVAKLFRLTIFAAVLAPAWWKIGFYYLSSKVVKDVRYGPNPRNYCDIYGARSDDSKTPVLVLVMGGAWIIGYKAWSALLAKYLSENGVIVVAVDYRNFPQGDIEDMQRDVHHALSWTYKNVSKYGGDPNDISILGQSAGSHISCLCVLQYIASLRNEEEQIAPGIPGIGKYKLKNFISLSGPYDLPSQSVKFAEHGFHSVIFSLVMKGDLNAYSPSHWIKRKLLAEPEQGHEIDSEHETVSQPPIEIHNNKEGADDDEFSVGFGRGKEILLPDERAEVERELEVEKTWRENYLPDPSRLGLGIGLSTYEDEESPFPTPASSTSPSPSSTPPMSPSVSPLHENAAKDQTVPLITIIHGMKDQCVSWQCAYEFADLLDKAAIPNSLQLDVDKTHTDYIVEGLLEGSEKSIITPILRTIYKDNNSTLPSVPSSLQHEPITISKILVRIARVINPF